LGERKETQQKMRDELTHVKARSVFFRWGRRNKAKEGRGLRGRKEQERVGEKKAMTSFP